MIDLHCHIIPDVDDGAANAAAACAMAEHSLRVGVDTIVATPHCNLRGARLCTDGRAYAEAFELFRALLRQRRIPLTLLSGAEVFAHPANFRQLLDGGRLVTLNRSRYLLVEFRFQADEREISALLAAVVQHGLIPVVAHPERYAAVQRRPSLVAEWFADGYIIQMNKGSLLGRLGVDAERTAFRLLHHGLVHVIATDAHDPIRRPTGFLSLLSMAERFCPREYLHLLLEENPRRIIGDKPVCAPSEVML